MNYFTSIFLSVSQNTKWFGLQDIRVYPHMVDWDIPPPPDRPQGQVPDGEDGSAGEEAAEEELGDEDDEEEDE